MKPFRSHSKLFDHLFQEERIALFLDGVSFMMVLIRVDIAHGTSYAGDATTMVAFSLR